jgi:hypothetical protein
MAALYADGGGSIDATRRALRATSIDSSEVTGISANSSGGAAREKLASSPLEHSRELTVGLRHGGCNNR